MAQVIVMPKLGLTMEEGTISKWYKAEGDTVEKGDPLFEVETEKVTNDVESEVSGILRKVIIATEDNAKCGEPVAIIAEPDEDIANLLW